ncbi:hypothetical protein FHX37_2897 [Haloactinospora alba]|uniref:Uncharacterized protein n=1 Tax=Haloactinospora alba TaxID=405555 RepID=A0A543NM61_9ACTN|nr:hypothetical protein [Haloactinospora alba]TQN32909.1 hypothetical protein FHX37_2897 [Haloactinospora alba]
MASGSACWGWSSSGSLPPNGLPGFPPGIALILVRGTLVAFWIRWWTPVSGILISAWIVSGGLLSQELTANLASGEPGTVTGNIVMCAGLVVAAVAGGMAMVRGRSRDRV